MISGNYFTNNPDLQLQFESIIDWEEIVTAYEDGFTDAEEYKKTGNDKLSLAPSSLQEAIEYYTDIFDESKIEMMVPYSANDNDKENFIKHSRFCLDGQCFMAMDSSAPHKFGFNEAISFVVNCDTQEEIDYYWSNLSAVPEAEQCGWLKDKFGLSWQIVPSIMSEMMASGTEEQLKRVTECFLKMKKFDIAKLEEAYGE
jgi:predicted 3-demethylubiquinone-9 3-methyltransferase (glyoxalase superfamily)